MVRAYVLLDVQPGKERDVLKKILATKGVTGADVVTGPYDVVAQIEAKDPSGIGWAVMEARTAGVVNSVTCVVVGES